jgi:hypothetical protein
MISARPRTPGAMAIPLPELWNEPRDLASRDLRWGPGSQSDAPSTEVDYTVKSLDRTGYSKGFDVVGPDGRTWDIKIGKEAQTEVVVSRILWALGYHQPVNYYVVGWRLAGEHEGEGEPARFRLQSDHESEGEWMWLDNPFQTSRALNGLIAVNILFNNWDLKDSNNRIYRMEGRVDGPSRRYVVQDLGASLGKPRVFPLAIGSRNAIGEFESGTLVAKVEGSDVALNYRGRHRTVLERMSVADLVWACELMNRLSESQLDDAFNAAGYSPDIRKRFVTKIRAKIQEGLALRTTLASAAVVTR